MQQRRWFLGVLLRRQGIVETSQRILLQGYVQESCDGGRRISAVDRNHLRRRTPSDAFEICPGDVSPPRQGRCFRQRRVVGRRDHRPERRFVLCLLCDDQRGFRVPALPPEEASRLG